MSSTWPAGKASVILLPSGEQGAAVLQRAGEWTEMGLLGPALWVQPESVRPSPSGPPFIEAVVWGIGRDQRLREVRVDLFEALAFEPLALVRLVKLRSASPSRELDAEQDDIADVVADYLVKSMPMASPSANIVDQPTDLTRATLICAPTEFQLQQRVDWAASEYGAVVVASPEDRSSPWSGDAFVRDNDRFTGFALMHLASVAGLWSGVHRGTFELFPREHSGLQSVWVSRVFLNAVLTESLARRTAAHVLDEASHADSLMIDPSVASPPEGTFFIEDADVAGYVDRMVEATMSLDGAALSFQRPAPTQERARRGAGFVAQLTGFFSFAGDKLARMPYWSWRRISFAANRALTKRLQGDGAEAGADPDAEFDVRDRLLIAERDRIRDSEREARAQLSLPAGVSVLRTTPRLWARLRELVFGALDGSADLSELGFAPREGKVPVFGRVSDVLSLPDDAWTLDSPDLPPGLPNRIDWHALALSDPRETLVAWVDAATARRGEAEAAVSSAEHEIAALRHRLEVGEWQVIVDGDGTERVDVDRRDAARGESEGEGVGLLTAAPVTPATFAVAGDGGAEAIPSASSERAPDAEGVTEGAEDADSAETAAAAETAAPAQADTAADAPPLRQRRRADPAGERLLAAATARRDEAQAAHDEAVELERSRAAVVLDFDTWAVNQDRSFVRRLLTRLAQDRREAEESVAELARGVDRIQVPAEGELVRLRKAFHGRMLGSWLITAVIATLLALIPVWVPGLRTAVPWYPSLLWLVLTGIVVVLFLTLIALTEYHRGWSRFRRRVDRAHADLAQLSEGSTDARREVARLASLHRQTVDWLKLLSTAIHHPWHVRPEWLERPGHGVARASMPFAMQLAAIEDDDHAAASRLRRMTIDQLVVRGWRHQAFRDLIREVGIELGEGATSFGLESLDEDLPHSSNHTRQMLADTMGVESVLTRVAGPRLRELIATIQRTALHGSRPRVRVIGENPMAPLVNLHDPADAGEAGVAWDDFLLGSLAGRREPVTPLSATVLSRFEVQEGHHEQVQSYLVMPRRLESSLDIRAGVPVTPVVYDEESTGALDMVWRVDIAGPLPIGAIHLWDRRGRPAEPSDVPATAHDTGDSGV